MKIALASKREERRVMERMEEGAEGLGLAMVSTLHRSLSQRQSFCAPPLEVLHLLCLSPGTASYPAGKSVTSEQSLSTILPSTIWSLQNFSPSEQVFSSLVREPPGITCPQSEPEP